MSDRGLPVRFGFFPEPVAADPAGVVEDVLLAERLGYDLVGIQDHPYNPHYLDTMTLLAVLAARTTRIGLFPDVASLPLRPPAVLAKSAASLDLLSGGRFDLGLGAGAIWPAIGAYGGPQRSAGEAVAALEEAIRVLRLLWSDERSVRLHGAHYRLDGAHPGPRPSRAIGVWIGAYGPRMLALTGRLADGWLPSAAFLPPDKLGDAQRRLDDAATAAGRPPEAVRRIYNISGEITDGTDRAFLQGPVKRWVDELRCWCSRPAWTRSCCGQVSRADGRWRFSPMKSCRRSGPLSTRPAPTRRRPTTIRLGSGAVAACAGRGPRGSPRPRGRPAA